MMNYFLPLKGIASMHCSANVGESGDVAIFFGYCVCSGVKRETGGNTPNASAVKKITFLA